MPARLRVDACDHGGSLTTKVLPSIFLGFHFVSTDQQSKQVPFWILVGGDLRSKLQERIF
jgi:hypothetical protein